MTDIEAGKKIAELKHIFDNIEAQYYPFSMDNEAIDQSLDEFLNIFKEGFTGNEDVFPVIIPAFFEVNNWDKKGWDLGELDYGKAYIALNNEDVFKQVLKCQQGIDSIEGGGGFTSVVVGVENAEDKRLSVVIKRSERSTMQENKTDNGIEIAFSYPCVEQFKKFKYKKAEGSVRSLSLDENHDCNIENVRLELGSFDFKEKPEYCEKYEKLIPPSQTHSLYVTDEYSFLFVFSRSVKFQEGEITGLGGLYVLVKNDFLDDNQCKLFIKNFFGRMSDVLSIRIINYYQLSLLRKKQIKSAIAAIMARNMSHNLGSHVLSYLKSDLAKDLQQPCSDEQQPLLNGVSKFLGYLQERQDFIATISTDYIPYFSSVNFKDFFYDELNPDLKAERHVESAVKNILLDYIVKSEGYTRDNIAICFKGFNGRKGQSVDLDELRDINIDIPGGIMGRQAFFSIFENILRNTAKHGSKNKKIQLIIDIEKEGINNSSPDVWKVRIVDDNNKNVSGDVLGQINEGLKEPYIDVGGGVVPTNKGLKEMRISAAWLRGYNVANIDEENICPKIFQVKLVEKEDDQWKDFEGEIAECNDPKLKLAYEFYMPVVQNCVLVTNETCSNIFGDDISDGLYLQVKTAQQYKEYENKNFKFVFIDIGLESEEKQTLREISVTRTIEVELEHIKESINRESDLYCDYYKEWIKEKYCDFKPLLNENPYILIIDKHKDSIEKTIDDEQVRCFSDESTAKKCQDLAAGLIVFRGHNDTPVEFNKFIKFELFNRSLFVEGISGNNSTDRLIRNEPKGTKWRLRMTEAALTKIIVIDERIFEKLEGVMDESTSVDFEVGDLIEWAKAGELKSKLSQKMDLSAGVLVDISELDNKGAQPSDAFRNLYADLCVLSGNNSNDKSASTDNCQKIIYEKKNINVLNFQLKDDNFLIYDLSGKKVECLCKINNLIGTHGEGGFKADFVLIHQTILDKIYKWIGGENVDDKDKEKIFGSLTRLFEARFKYIIHSGRGKPDFLPSKTCFNQYSSVEAAFFDCKYSLCELLYSARIDNRVN